MMTPGPLAPLVRAVALVLFLASVGAGEDVVRRANGPVPIYEYRFVESRIVATVQPGDQLEVIARDGDWVRVLAPTDRNGTRRAGWIPREQLSSLRGVRPASDVRSAEANKVNAGAKPAAPSVPPAPVGTRPADSAAAQSWFQPRGLRASVGLNYQSANVAQDTGALDDRLLGGGATLVTSLAILDPRIVTIDFSGDFQASRANSRVSSAASSNTSGLQSYRVALGLLSGRSAPLQVYADRVSSASTLQPFGVSPDPLRHTRGVHRGAGFSWDVDAGSLLPHVQVSASTTHQSDERDYLFGYGSTNEERRAELRLNRDYKRARYDFDFMHGAYVYAVPGANVQTATGNDLLLGTVRLSPVNRLELDVNGRVSQFRFGSGAARSLVNGAGADAAVRYQMSRRLATIARYAFSNNTAEAAISGKLAPGTPGVLPVVTASLLQTRALFQDGEGRLEYTTQRLKAATILKGTAYGVPRLQAETLAAIATAGGLLRFEQPWRRVTFSAGIDGSAGRAQSNFQRRYPYREVGADVGLTSDWAGVLRLGATLSQRRVGRLPFYPVTLDARNATLRFETLRPNFARLRASLSRFDTLRDVVSLDARDVFNGFSVGLAGPWYDLSLDVNQTDVRSLLLAADVLGSRPDVAMLVVSRPELFRNLLATSDRSHVLGLQVRPTAALQLQARVRRQQQAYPGLFGYDMRGAQVSASWQLRELQLEVGWEYFDSATSFGNVRDRRLYVRFRRDVLFF